MFFDLGTMPLLLVLLVLVFGSAVAGTALGRHLRSRPESDHEPVGVVQGTLLGLMGLLLAFGLTMAVGRYDERRALVVEEANAISSAHLQAQLLDEPERGEALELLAQYADAAIDLSAHGVDTAGFEADAARMEEIQRELWATGAAAVEADPQGNASLLYVGALDEVFDAHETRIASLRNRVPHTVVLLQVLGSTVAVGVLACYLAMLGRGVGTSLVAAAVVVMILFISLDLDRPNRGAIEVHDAPLTEVRADMDLPPAADGGG